MKITITHQETYSRGQLLLRHFFGWLYIAIPHVFLLYFVQIAASVLSFISWWAVLFTGKYPQNFFEFQVNLQKWSLRMNLRLMDMADGYPQFGLSSSDPNSNIEIQNPEKLNQGLLLLRTFFGMFYVIIPHGFILMFRGIACMFIMFLAFWIILITGKYPEGMFKFMVETMRWGMRVSFYMKFMTDDYPPFHGRELPE
jgi:hypothetical protein